MKMHSYLVKISEIFTSERVDETNGLMDRVKV